jgi:hypothetical protein
VLNTPNITNAMQVDALKALAHLQLRKKRRRLARENGIHTIMSIGVLLSCLNGHTILDNRISIYVCFLLYER